MCAVVLSVLALVLSLCFTAPVQSQVTPIEVANDVAVFNLALTLENLDSTFFACYLYPLNNTYSFCAGRGYNGFSAMDFANAGYNATVFNSMSILAQEEVAHANYISTTLTALGQQPVTRCNYTFGTVGSVSTFLSMGQAFENAGTSAYAGSLNGISTPLYQQYAVTIASVEARHAAYLNALLPNDQYPIFSGQGFDRVRTPSEVIALITPFLQGPGCVLPTVPSVPKPYGVAAYSGQPSQTNYTGYQSQATNTSYTPAERVNDIKALNYALVLENLESNFYNAAGAIYNASYFSNVTTYNYFQIIAANENQHVATLRAVITAYGGTPVANCTYNFTAALASFASYVATAAVLENTGVQAYNGAANTIVDTNLQQVAAQIDMIEARHAAFLNMLVNQTAGAPAAGAAFPSAFDTATAPGDIVNAVLATGLIVSCPFNLTAPYLPVVIPLSQQLPAAYSSSSGLTGNSTSSSSTGSTPVPSTSAMITLPRVTLPAGVSSSNQSQFQSAFATDFANNLIAAQSLNLTAANLTQYLSVTIIFPSSGSRRLLQTNGTVAVVSVIIDGAISTFNGVSATASTLASAIQTRVANGQFVTSPASGAVVPAQTATVQVIIPSSSSTGVDQSGAATHSASLAVKVATIIAALMLAF